MCLSALNTAHISACFSKQGLRRQIEHGTALNAASLQIKVGVSTYPCPIFSYLVYFFLGSPMLTIVPKEEKRHIMLFPLVSQFNCGLLCSKTQCGVMTNPVAGNQSVLDLSTGTSMRKIVLKMTTEQTTAEAILCYYDCIIQADRTVTTQLRPTKPVLRSFLPNKALKHINQQNFRMLLSAALGHKTDQAWYPHKP